MTKIDVKGTSVTVISGGTDDYISLTDIARYKNSDHTDDLIRNWLRNRNTLEFLGIWEQLNNTDYHSVEFDGIRMQAGLNSFTLTPKRWIEATGAIGISSRAGRYGGTYAHKDIAFEFASWVSVEFKLYLIKEFQRLKEQEAISGGLEWSIRRSLSKVQYRVHTDAIKNNLIPQDVGRAESGYVYATEADMLNKALFGVTAKEWKANNPKAIGNIRDGATMEQLVVLSSLESQNALLIQQKMPQSQRVVMLNALARAQLTALLENPSMKKLDGGSILG